MTARTYAMAVNEALHARDQLMCALPLSNVNQLTQEVKSKLKSNYKDEDVHCASRLISIDKYFSPKATIMVSDEIKTIEKISKVNGALTASIREFQATELQFIESSKLASGKVRDAAEKLGQGIIRIEKAANFDRLEKYVDLLERAASAMAILAEIEKSGKLEKIAAAIR